MRFILRVIPANWRPSVERDLIEEAERSGRRGWRGRLWLIWHALRIAIRLRTREISRARMRPGAAFSGIMSDVRFAVRLFAREPWVTSAIVITLAAGIGAATAGYAVFNHLLFRPVPGVQDDGRLMTIYFQPPSDLETFGAAPRGALAALRQAPGVESLAASQAVELSVVARSGADPANVNVEFVTDGFFRTLGVRASAGRLFSDEEIEQAVDLAIVSRRLADRELGRPTAAIGQRLTVSGRSFLIAGVIDGYHGWDSVRVPRIDVWLPMTVRQALNLDHETYFNLIGRWSPGATPDVVQSQLGTAFVGVGRARLVMTTRSGLPPSGVPPMAPIVYPGLVEIPTGLTPSRMLALYPFVMAAAAVLLLLACANSANLLLARTLRRWRELAVRSAIGAGRWRIARGQLAEATVLGLAALAGGLIVAKVLTGLARGYQIVSGGPGIEAVEIDWRILVFSSTSALVTILLFGVIPAASAAHAAQSFVHPSGRVTRPSSRLRAGLVAAQVALSLTLLAGAGVLVRSLDNLRASDLGVKPDGVISFGVRGRRLGLSDARLTSVIGDTMARLGQAPGAQGVAFSAPAAFFNDGWIPVRVRPAGAAAPDVRVESSVVSGSYFDVLGISMRAGRAFTDAEFSLEPKASSRVAILSEPLARELFGDVSPVGRRIDVGSGFTGGWEFDRTLEIVGVAGAMRSGLRFRDGPRVALYESARPRLAWSTVYARSTLPDAAALAAARETVRMLEPNLPLVNAGTLGDEIERLIPEDRALTSVVTMVAVLATLLAMAGIYAVVSHAVSERTREFGIRVALGATRGAIVANVVRRISLTSAAGALAGLGLFAVASRWLASRVYGVSALDPLTIATAIVVLLATGLAAAWLPARRAGAVDPTVALRTE
jgi:predicted permease